MGNDSLLAQMKASSSAPCPHRKPRGTVSWRCRTSHLDLAAVRAGHLARLCCKLVPLLEQLPDERVLSVSDTASGRQSEEWNVKKCESE